MLRAAVYPEAIVVTSLVLSVYWVRIAATPRERWRFYAEAARRLRLPAYRPDTALTASDRHHAQDAADRMTSSAGEGCH